MYILADEMSDDPMIGAPDERRPIAAEVDRKRKGVSMISYMVVIAKRRSSRP